MDAAKYRATTLFRLISNPNRVPAWMSLVALSLIDVRSGEHHGLRDALSPKSDNSEGGSVLFDHLVVAGDELER